MPTSALASEGDNVVLSFSPQLQALLWVALCIGILALLYGLVVLRNYVMAQSPGDEKMQEVGLAIHTGAMAYLKKQMGTMAIFIVLLAAGLFGLYFRLGTGVAAGVALCFVLGVSASYLSGYVGMWMAVSGNMRTAHAALTSYRSALIVAFRSGAVAGMVTVGVGLIGATTILLVAPAISTYLLVGFGFGASLAALFMRVGGGIFTKAADVGADLVGKVEAGIPEDDPRNPAVIADNVGDNVGDCAGMAADVFESFEVMLVAAIVLGAATSTIFDAQTWPRLIVFGLLAAAAGLFSSIIGVQLVDTKDDVEADPLKALKRGFNIAAGLSFLITGGLAFAFLGGAGNPVQTTQLVATTQYEQNETKALQALRQEIADKDKKQPYEVATKDLLADPRAKALGFAATDEPTVTQSLAVDLEKVPPASNLTGLTKVVDFNDKNLKSVLDYAVQTRPQPGQPQQKPFQTLAAAYGSNDPQDKLVVAKLHVKADLPARPAQGSMPAQAASQIDRTQWIGPLAQKDLDLQVKNYQQAAAQQKIVASLEVLSKKDVSLYASPDGRIALGVEGGKDLDRPSTLHSAEPLTYYKASVDTMQGIFDKARASSQAPAIPPTGTIELAVVNHQPVPWYTFWIAIAFGIAMAFAIEFITDYYVSTNKAPTQEVAGVATAGPAPMVIQGFAHAATSSVFMTLAIVVALMFPLIVFSPAQYGSYNLCFFGIALVGLGLLTTTAFILAMDTFGPISDNAQGVFEMSGAHVGNPKGAKIVARLDAAGNTTKALTKGFAIATAVVAAVALFNSYRDQAHLTSISLDVPEIFLGLLIGAAAPYLFSAYAINAVGRSSFELINEVRRQFREDPGIMKGTSKPDYARCVAMVTAAAQRELLSPGILAIALPAAVGFGFGIGKAPVTIGGHSYVLTGAQALGGFLAGAIASGQLMAVLLANSGGMWDNAKKLIEDGMHGGKGTEAHKASIVGDTIGDPFKDTAGPALNPLIKVMNLVAVLLSGVIILPMDTIIRVGVTVVCVGALIVSVMLARRGSMSDALKLAHNEPPATHVESTGALAESIAAAPQPPLRTAKKKLFVESEEDNTDKV